VFLLITTFLAAFGIIFLAGLAHIKITKHKMLRRAKRILGDHGAKETGFKCSFRNNHGDHGLAVKLRLVVFFLKAKIRLLLLKIVVQFFMTVPNARLSDSARHQVSLKNTALVKQSPI